MNFLLHGRYLMQQPANMALIMLTSLLDLFIISLLVLLWPGGRGLESPFFVFYYPVVLAFGFVVSRPIEAGYTALALIAYSVTSFVAHPGLIYDSGDLKVLVLRLVTIGAIGGLANYYFRIQRERRRTVISTYEAPEPRTGSGA